MAVPEATVDEDTPPPFRIRYVRPTWQIFFTNTKTRS
jgi:hypothetical protein